MQGGDSIATPPVAEAVSALSSSVEHGRNGINALLSCRLSFFFVGSTDETGIRQIRNGPIEKG